MLSLCPHHPRPDQLALLRLRVDAVLIFWGLSPFFSHFRSFCLLSAVLIEFREFLSVKMRLVSRSRSHCKGLQTHVKHGFPRTFQCGIFGRRKLLRCGPEARFDASLDRTTPARLLLFLQVLQVFGISPFELPLPGLAFVLAGIRTLSSKYDPFSIC